MSDNPSSLEKRFIKYCSEGTWKKVPAVSDTWVIKRAFPQYIPPPTSTNKTIPLGAKESWLELASMIYSDLLWLLNLEHHCFWSQIILDKSPLCCITSFLQEASPIYCKNSYPQDVQSYFNKLSRVVFLIFKRLATQRESPHEFITPDILGKILYDHYIFTVPSLLDICVVYGGSNRVEISQLIEDVTSMQPNYLQDFKDAVPHLTQILEKSCDNLSTDVKKMEDMLTHVYDSIVTTRIFLEIFPKGCVVFINPQLAAATATFYTSTMPFTSKLPEIQELVVNLRLECLKFVRTLMESILSAALESLNPNDVESYLSLISEMMSEGLFICDYHALYPIDMDFDVISSICPDIDTMKLDYLEEALASHVDIKLKKIEKPKSTVNHKVNYSQLSAAAGGPGPAPPPSTPGVGSVQLLSLISQVQDILPDFEDGFIEECLKYYEFSPERVISAVLESTLPPTLEEMDWKMKRPSVSLPERSNVYDFDEFDTRTGAQVDKTRMYRGKKPRQHKNINEMLADKRDVNAMKDKFAGLGFIEDEYDDEYDDTYDSVDVAVKEPDGAADRRRRFVVPRVLQTYEAAEESDEESDEEEAAAAAIKKDHFVQNPEELRAKAEQRRAQARGQRDVVGRAKGHGQDKQVLINRDKKNVSKSSVGNHHRRDRASKKRNQGMIPS